MHTALFTPVCLAQPSPAPQKVSVHLVSSPLSELMQTLSKQTRLAWKCHRDLPNLRITAIAQDMPVQTFRDRLAETLHLSWKQETNPDKTLVTGYTLYKSPRNIQEEQSLLDKGEEALRQRLDLAIRAAFWSKKEREQQLDPQSQLVLNLQNPQFEASFRFLGQLSLLQREQMLNGQDTLAPYDDSAKTPLQATLKDLLESMRWDANSPTTARFHRDGSYGDAGVLIEIKEARGGTSGFRIPLLQRKDIYSPEEAKRSKEEYRSARKPFYLDKEIADEKFDKVLEQIAEATGANIISESYHDYAPFPLSVRRGETTLEKLFDAIMFNHRFWRKRGNVYLIQNEYWFIERRFQVDVALIRRMKDTLKKRGLTLEEWGEVGKLSVEQWMALQTLKIGEFDMMQFYHPLLAFYGELTESQRRNLFEPQGLSVQHLSSPDTHRLEKWANSLKGLIPNLDKYPKDAYRVKATVEEGTTRFQLVVLVEDVERLIAEQIMFTAPKVRTEKPTFAKNRLPMSTE
ncbi:MAG: hypothetical protein NT023_25745 [Armatimonadetes bacterium]|nr:hypothetical protein [Armatimonadota bacterium]